MNGRLSINMSTKRKGHTATEAYKNDTITDLSRRQGKHKSPRLEAYAATGAITSHRD